MLSSAGRALINEVNKLIQAGNNERYERWDQELGISAITGKPPRGKPAIFVTPLNSRQLNQAVNIARHRGMEELLIAARFRPKK